eukprot:GEMP01067161.1.p1 GENE.GEMP01067161.1~~GEMP01067161.1.p1  ORF type:complete len:309 (+),score=35.99 GEMP01067161.1:101-1027(+)
MAKDSRKRKNALNLFDIDQWIFPIPEASYTTSSYPGEMAWIPGDRPMERFPALLFPCPTARFMFVLMHSNGEDLGNTYKFCRDVREFLQVHVVSFEYPGYGVCSAKTSEVEILRRGRIFLRYIKEGLHWPLESTKLVGRSVGTFVATRLALEFPVCGLILISPFISIRRVAVDRFGIVGHFISSDRMSNEMIEKVTCPILLFHGENDKLVNPSHSHFLMTKIRHEMKMLVVCPGMGHNTNIMADINIFTHFVSAMLTFCRLPDYDFVEEVTLPDDIFVPPMVVIGGSKQPLPATGDLEECEENENNVF